MDDINLSAVVVATLAAFVMSVIYYMGFAKQMAKLSKAYANMNVSNPQKLVELSRNFVLSLVIAHFVVRLDVNGFVDAVKFGTWLWIGFPLVLLVGSVIWEKVPRKLAVIHLGDWLIKIMLICIILAQLR